MSKYQIVHSQCHCHHFPWHIRQIHQYCHQIENKMGYRVLFQSSYINVTTGATSGLLSVYFRSLYFGTFPWHFRQLRILNGLVVTGQFGFEFKVIERSFWMIKFWRRSVKTFVIGGRWTLPNFFRVFSDFSFLKSFMSSGSWRFPISSLSPSVNINQCNSCHGLAKQKYIWLVSNFCAIKS